MGCTKCKTEKCSGCGQVPLSINDLCNPIQCDVDACPESFDANCTFYTGPDLICDDVVIVPTGTSIAQATANIIAYFCLRTTLIAGDNIVITTNDEGNTVIDTAAPLLRKYVATGLFADADNQIITIPRASLADCNIPTTGCNAANTSFADIVVQGFYLNTGSNSWVNITEQDKVLVTVNSAGDVIIYAGALVFSQAFPISWRVTIIG